MSKCGQYDPGNTPYSNGPTFSDLCVLPALPGRKYEWATFFVTNFDVENVVHILLNWEKILIGFPARSMGNRLHGQDCDVRKTRKVQKIAANSLKNGKCGFYLQTDFVTAEFYSSDVIPPNIQKKTQASDVNATGMRRAVETAVGEAVEEAYRLRGDAVAAAYSTWFPQQGTTNEPIQLGLNEHTHMPTANTHTHLGEVLTRKMAYPTQKLI